MSKYSIRELERLSGIKAHTIRIWEKRYNVIEPSRTDTNIRYYSDEDLKKLLNIAILNRKGMRISDIANMKEKELAKKVMEYSYNSRDVESQIEQMVIAMVDLDESKFNQLLNTAIMHDGFEKAIINIIFPFFEKIGILWQTNSINPAQEHFVSNLFRQKLMVAIDNLMIPDKEGAKKFVLFLPENEFHELGLLFYNYLIKKAGHSVIYLGTSVPVEDLEMTVKKIKPHYLFTTITAALDGEELEKYIKDLSIKFESQTVFVAGMKMYHNSFSLPENVEQVNSPFEFSQELNRI
jgi:DNA-binding transcriptional MerR regulator